MLKKYYCINDVSDQVTPDAKISHFDCSPNGLHIACVHDNAIQIYNIQTGNQVGEDMVDCSDEILAIRYSINGDLLIAAGDDHQIYIWDTTTYQLNGVPLIGHTYFINSLAISPNGSNIASSSFDDTLRIWTLKDRVCVSMICLFAVHSLQYVQANIQYSIQANIQYSIYGDQLSYVCQNQIKTLHTKSLIVYKVYQRRPIERIQINDRLLVSSSCKQAEILDKLTHKQIRKLDRGEDDIEGITISPDKKFVAIISEREIYVCDIQRGKRYGSFVDENDLQFGEGKFSIDGRAILTANQSGVLRTELSAILKA